MKKIFNLMMIALVAMCSLQSCSEDCDHTIIEHDHSADLVGTWTCFQEDFAEALVIKTDGSIVATGLADDKFWENVNGTITVKDGNATLDFEDGVTFEGHIDIIPGTTFSIMDNNGERVTFHYCKEDLSDEILGMWVCNETPTPVENDMLIINYKANGTTLFSGYFYEARDFWVNAEGSYKVIGDLLFHKQPDNTLETGVAKYSAMKLLYAPDANLYGDLMYLLANARVGENYVPATTTWLRIKQHLDLPGMKYDYSNLYLSNVKGKDKEISFMGYTLNFATMDGSKLKQMLQSTLFHVEFPNANTIKYTYQFSDQKNTVQVPIVVEGNKLTLQMSELGSALKDVVFHAFQDQDNTQMHLYMHRDAVVNFYTNMQAFLDTWTKGVDVVNDAEAVKDIYDSIDEAIETINLSIILK